MHDAIILIPTYNEKANLRPLVTKIRSKTQAHVLFIDDDSPDGTGELADELARGTSDIHVLHRPHKEGIGAAYKDGFAWALARPFKYFLMMDADLSHNPETLPLFLEALGHYDAVFASRYCPGGGTRDWSKLRLAFSVFSNCLIRLMLNLRSISDITTAYKGFRRSTLETIDVCNLPGNKNGFLIHLVHSIARNGFKTVEVPIVFYGRKEGKSKGDSSIIAESTQVIFGLFRDRLSGRDPYARRSVH